MSWFPFDSDSAWQKRMRQFSSGFLAGALASFVTMPAEVIRANAQALRLNSLDASAQQTGGPSPEKEAAPPPADGTQRRALPLPRRKCLWLNW